MQYVLYVVSLDNPDISRKCIVLDNAWKYKEELIKWYLCHIITPWFSINLQHIAMCIQIWVVNFLGTEAQDHN